MCSDLCQSLQKHALQTKRHHVSMRSDSTPWGERKNRTTLFAGLQHSGALLQPLLCAPQMPLSLPHAFEQRPQITAFFTPLSLCIQLGVPPSTLLRLHCSHFCRAHTFRTPFFPILLCSSAPSLVCPITNSVKAHNTKTHHCSQPRIKSHSDRTQMKLFILSVTFV